MTSLKSLLPILERSMHTKTKFVANDGSEYDSEEQALKREGMIVAVDVALAHLRPVPTETSFANGGGFVQQDPEAVLAAKQDLYKIANQDGVLKWWLDSQKSDHGKTDYELISVHPSWFGRMLDGGHRPLERAYGRLCCIDNQNREWGQQYYAMKSDKGEPVEP